MHQSPLCLRTTHQYTPGSLYPWKSLLWESRLIKVSEYGRLFSFIRIFTAEMFVWRSSLFPAVMTYSVHSYVWLALLSDSDLASPYNLLIAFSGENTALPSSFDSSSFSLPVIKVALISCTFSPCRVPDTTLLLAELPFPCPRIASRRSWIGSVGESSSGVKLNFMYANILSPSPLLLRKRIVVIFLFKRRITSPPPLL